MASKSSDVERRTRRHSTPGLPAVPNEAESVWPRTDDRLGHVQNTLQQIERSYVEAALALTNGNLSQAAKLLGIHRTTLYSRMQNYVPNQSIDSNSSER